MLELNWLVIIASGLIPLLTGFIWYNPKVLGNAWMKAADITEEKMQGSNMPLIFGLTLLLGLFLALAIMQLVIHQTHYYSILADNKDMADPNSAISQATKAFMDVNGSNFRTFKHGALHGTLGAIFTGLPIIGINALFERKSRNYVLIHLGYWVLTMAFMGGVICAFA
jgi:Protein of unknown function (DUF1761)